MAAQLPTRPPKGPGRHNIAPGPSRPRTFWLKRLHEELERTKPR